MIRCKRCTGLMIRDNDYYGMFDRCIMCGWYIDYTAKVVIPPELRGHMSTNRYAETAHVEVNFSREAY